MNHDFESRLSTHILAHAEAHGLNEAEAGAQFADHLATLVKRTALLKKLADNADANPVETREAMPVTPPEQTKPKGTGGGKKPMPHDLGDKATLPPDHNN